MTESTEHTDGESADTEKARWDAPPGTLWHGVLGFVLAGLLWATSYPGLDFLSFMGASVVLALLGLHWFFRLVHWLFVQSWVGGWRWLLAPTMVIGAFVLVVVQAPLLIRFELARGDFERVAAELEPAGTFEDWERLETPESLGSYEIRVAYQVEDMVIFYEKTGSGFFDDAGFAYLPAGPDQRLGNGWFESPTFQHLSGDWYAWQASW